MDNAWINYYKTRTEYYGKHGSNADIIISLLDLQKSDVVLDIGCGPGAYLEDIRRKAASNCFGIDISFDAVMKRSKKNLIVADMCHLPFKAETFNKIFSLGTVEHRPNTEKILSDIFRVSKRNSKIYLTVPNKLSFFHVTKHLKMLFGKWDLGYEKSFSTFGFERLLKRQGFKPKQTYVTPHGKINNVFNFFDNALNKLSDKLFGFFVCSLSEK